MNNSKIWLVVNPPVGIPLFLGAVAVGSFAVHVAVVSNTDWVSEFLSGSEMTSEMAAVATQETVQTASATTFGDGQRVQIQMPDGTTTWAVIEAEQTTLASALLPRSGNSIIETAYRPVRSCRLTLFSGRAECKGPAIAGGDLVQHTRLCCEKAGSDCACFLAICGCSD